MAVALGKASSPQDSKDYVLMVAEALTPVHVGVGRAPGVVDLPVIRDSLGYPFIPASGIKGALKNMCLLRNLNDPSRISQFLEDGRLRCSDDNNDVKICCCLFGPEPGEGDKGAGMLSILDMVLLAMPAPSADKGYVYVTADSLLMRAEMIAEALGMEDIAENPSKLKEDGSEEDVDIAGVVLKARKLKLQGGGTFASLLKSLGGLARSLDDRLYLVDDNVGVHVIDKALQRVTRVRLRVDMKVVVGRGLWTEEYVPAGTVFVGGIVRLPFRNEYCSNIGIDGKSLHDILGEHVFNFSKKGGGNDVAYVMLGGKGTIGKGILKVKIAGNTRRGSAEGRSE